MLAFWLRLFEVCSCIDACAIVRNQTAVVILDYGYAVRLSTLLRICDHFYRPCRLFILLRIQALLLEETFVSSKLAENKILIRVPLILLNEQVVGGRNWVMFIILHLFDGAVQSIQELQVRRGLHLVFDLFENRDIVLAYDDSVQLILRQLHKPGVLLDLVYFVAFGRIALHDVLHHVLGLLIDIAGHQILT